MPFANSPSGQAGETSPTCTGSEHAPELARKYRRQDLAHNRAQPLAERELEGFSGARLEERRVLSRDLFGRTAVAEVVKRERLARHALRTAQRIGMAMIGEVRSAEHHQP